MIEIGIIGAGNFSVKHIQAIQQIEGLRIHAICRTNPDELNKLKDLYRVKGVNHVETDFYGQEGMLRINFIKGAFLGRKDHWELLPGSYEEDWMGKALVNEWKAFQNTIKLDLPSPISGEHGLNVMEVIFTALESGKTHKEIPIQFNPENSPK